MDNITKHPVVSFEQLPREVAEAHDKLDLIIGLLQGIMDSKQPSGPRMLTVEEAAAFLKKKVSTIYSMNCRGQLPVHHIGNKAVYFENELLEFIENDGKVSKDGETIEERADAVANGMNHKASGTVERNSKADEQKAINARVKQHEERQTRLKAEAEKVQNTPAPSDQTPQSNQMEADAAATIQPDTDTTIVGEETSANDADNSAVSGQQEPVAESADTATTDPVEESASIKTDANPSTGSDQGLSHSSFPSVSVVTKEHTQTHQPRYVLVFAQELTLSQKFDLKPVIDRFGGFLASYDNLYTFHTAEQAQRCCETIGRM